MKNAHQVILSAMKEAAHDRIEDIVALGMERKVIYTRLKNKLKVPPAKAHFGNMTTKGEVTRGIYALEEIREKYAEQVEKKRLKEARRLKHEANLQKKKDRKRYVGESVRNKIQEVARQNRILARTPKLLRPLVRLFL